MSPTAQAQRTLSRWPGRSGAAPLGPRPLPSSLGYSALREKFNPTRMPSSENGPLGPFRIPDPWGITLGTTVKVWHEKGQRMTEEQCVLQSVRPLVTKRFGPFTTINLQVQRCTPA